MRVLIVDDHQLFSAGLRLLLQQRWPELKGIDCAADGPQALERVQQVAYDLVLMDWRLGSGLAGSELAKRCLEARPQTQVAVISAFGSPRLIREAVEAGASGFVSKQASPDELLQALSVVMSGGVHLPDMAYAEEGPDSVLPQEPPLDGRALPPGARRRDIREAFPNLSARHVQVLARVVSGMSNKEIARALEISDGTVKQHINAIFREIGVSNRTEAVYLLAREGVRFR